MTRKRSRQLVIGAAAAIAVAVGLLLYGTWTGSGDAPEGDAVAEAAAATRRMPPTRFETLPDVLASVGGREIRKEDLASALDTYESDEGVPEDDIRDEFYEAVVWGAVRGEVLRQVLVPEARRRGIQLTERDRKMFAMTPNQAQMFGHMAPQIGMSSDEMLQRVEEALLIERMMMQEFVEIETVSEQEMVTEYETATDRYYTDDTYRARHIFLRPTEGETDGDFTARVRALAREAAAPGADFARLAEQHSVAPDASRGGLFDEFQMSDPPVRDGTVLQMLLRMKSGQVSPPVPRADGAEILLLEERRPPQRMTFEQARPKIQLRLQARKAKPKLQAWIAQMEQRAGVVINVPEPARLRMRRQRGVR